VNRTLYIWFLRRKITSGIQYCSPELKFCNILYKGYQSIIKSGYPDRGTCFMHSHKSVQNTNVNLVWSTGVSVIPYETARFSLKGL